MWWCIDGACDDDVERTKQSMYTHNRLCRKEGREGGSACVRSFTKTQHIPVIPLSSHSTTNALTSTRTSTYRLDRVKARRLQFLQVVGVDAVLLQNVNGLVRDGYLVVRGVVERNKK